MKSREMNRRELLSRAAALSFLPALGTLPLASRTKAATRPAFRRARPSDPEWPQPAGWQKLNESVGGRLIKVEPLLAACAPSSDEAACRNLLSAVQNPYYVGDQPAGTQTAGWVDAWMSAPSAYAVAAANVDDVVASVNFARENRLRLVVKGGGHSYQGTSDSADSLLIWTRAMDRIELHDAFVPQGCEGKQAPQPAVSIGAGAVWMHVYDAVTTKAGRYAQGGGCATVGVAGLVQSGGFGSFSKNYGTAAGGLLEAEIVTADGKVRLANSCSDPELFWGLKGGGGGSLGVVTRVTLRTRELPNLFGGVGLAVQAKSDAAFSKLIDRFLDVFGPRMTDPHWGESVTFGKDNSLSVTMVFQGLDESEAGDVWRPFVDWIAALPADYAVTVPLKISTMPAREWWSPAYMKANRPDRGVFDERPGAPQDNMWFGEQKTELGVFIHGYESLWLPANLLEPAQRSRCVDALFAATRRWAVALHVNKGLAGASAGDLEAARDTAMNPAVLGAFALAIVAGGEPGAYRYLLNQAPDLDVARQDAKAIGEAARALRNVAPEAGSYVSESNFFDPVWQHSFWASNYARLQSVKKTYDPDGLFFVHHGVGSEGWSANGFVRQG